MKCLFSKLMLPFSALIRVSAMFSAYPNAYGQTDVGADGQVVVVDFEALKIEVFPALIHCFPAKTQCGRERPQPSVKLGHHRNCI